MQTLSQNAFQRHMAVMMVLSVLAWAGFLLTFRGFWPGGHEPGDDLTVFWIWAAVGGPFFIVCLFAVYRLLYTPAAWRGSAAAALVAPALCCDFLAVTFFERWFPNPGSADDRAYAALLLGGVGVFLFAGLFANRVEVDSQE